MPYENLGHRNQKFAALPRTSALGTAMDPTGVPARTTKLHSRGRGRLSGPRASALPFATPGIVPAQYSHQWLGCRVRHAGCCICPRGAGEELRVEVCEAALGDTGECCENLRIPLHDLRK
eukprot:gnl/TRDRNA2_/TRDRNA2_148874_c0_seq2.p3 gnl/TRDRNA2_/TRDRNA2_148874_c0~~gnl/TRDRNA2_/TRDRNA2_148874_c0_seq2.p3  ORF type:complete len:120 (-),score=2.29 gnl/TRDRNA2_/TRDRNA2_148874_c0_seq2:341-700(-)